MAPLPTKIPAGSNYAAVTEAGFATIEASNGRESLEMMLAKWPDIVICDITMPVMDGHALIAEIQVNYPELSNVPFIFLTALADKQNLIEGLKAGASDYLTKPIDFDILLAKVAGCVTHIENDRKTGRAFRKAVPSLVPSFNTGLDCS